jgi:hypothetical protein
MTHPTDWLNGPSGCSTGGSANTDACATIE